MDELDQLKGFVKAMDMIFNSPPVEERRVAMIMPEENGGLGVFTAQIFDIPGLEYETAIIDAEGVYPVERYVTAAEAEAGHLRWVETSKGLVMVTRLGWLEGLVPAKDIHLKRVRKRRRFRKGGIA